MCTAPQPVDNHLLAALADAELLRLAPHMEWVDLVLGEVLYEPGDTGRAECRGRLPPGRA